MHSTAFYLMFTVVFVCALLADLAIKRMRYRARAERRGAAPADLEQRVRALESVVAEPEYELRERFRRL